MENRELEEIKWPVVTVPRHAPANYPLPESSASIDSPGFAIVRNMFVPVRRSGRALTFPPSFTHAILGVDPVIGTAPPVLQVEGVRKAFGKRTALEGVSFDVGPGERLALLGPNGAGKTTLIRCLSGRTRPDEGRIRLSGRPIGRPGVRDALGVVPQEIAVYPDLTTAENLHAFGRFHNLRGRRLRERVAWALRWTGLESRGSQLVGSFSGGMKRRVNLACGVLHRPQLLLLDEPTVGVDPQSREKIYRMLEELRMAGTSILLTTHHLEEAESFSDRIVIIDRGRVIAGGTLDQLVERTIGPDRLVRLRTDRPLSGPAELSPGHDSVDTRGGVWERVDDRHVSTRIGDVAAELPALIESVRRAGYDVQDVEVRSPSLHHVFLHLTGRELRE